MLHRWPMRHVLGSRAQASCMSFERAMLVISVTLKSHRVLDRLLGREYGGALPHWSPNAIIIKTCCSIAALVKICTTARKVAESSCAPRQRMFRLLNVATSSSFNLLEIHTTREQQVSVMMSLSCCNQGFLLSRGASSK